MGSFNISGTVNQDNSIDYMVFTNEIDFLKQDFFKNPSTKQFYEMTKGLELFVEKNKFAQKHEDTGMIPEEYVEFEKKLIEKFSVSERILCLVTIHMTCSACSTPNSSTSGGIYNFLVKHGLGVELLHFGMLKILMLYRKCS